MGLTHGCGILAVSEEERSFFWLLRKDRLSTRGLLRRRNMELESYDCVLCHFDTEETVHLFFHSPFAVCC